MRYRGACLRPWTHGPCCLSHHSLQGSLAGRTSLVRTYSAHNQPGPSPPTDPTPPERGTGAEMMKARTQVALQNAGELVWDWGQRSAQMALTTVNRWWERYEEFVGLNEVRDAQDKVTQAEATFMVARGMVREAHISLEALQTRLKEVRDRLDRVSREEAHYLELATLEHKLLQEERRLRTAYENAEGSEREKFALFSANVRESHEKERTRAERTKNWSIIGSVIGALIGVMGSTYINRVRLQELKTLLLEAQKGPESLQEALKVQAGNHRSQQEELQLLINSLRLTLKDSSTPRDDSFQDEEQPASSSTLLSVSSFQDLHVVSQRTESLLNSLLPQVNQMDQVLGRLEDELSVVRTLLEDRSQGETKATQVQQEMLVRTERGEHSEALVQSLEKTQRMMGDGIRQSTFYNAVFSYTAAAITVSAVYLLLRGVG